MLIIKILEEVFVIIEIQFPVGHSQVKRLGMLVVTLMGLFGPT